MLRSVVQNFVDSLTERELDAPLLAILSAHGFTDVHFIHGPYEFGKDVIAKKKDGATGTIKQYAIQSKAGDLGMTEWRAVRPQLEECCYNTIAHPGFDASLPRVVVLVTTGRLKGGAQADAQQFVGLCRDRGADDFLVWDADNLVGWMSDDPSLGLAGVGVADALIEIVAHIRRGRVSEPALERHSRMWTTRAIDGGASPRACLEAAILCSVLHEQHRLDLSCYMALHLYRAAWRPPDEPSLDSLAEASLQLFETYGRELLDQAEPLLTDPRELLLPVVDFTSIVTYPAMVCRLVEIFGILALTSNDASLIERARMAVHVLCETHPGAGRPPSDQFAVGLIPAVIALRTVSPDSARAYVLTVAQWIVDRHDPDKSGLGLGSLDESGEEVAARLLGGSLTFDGPAPRHSSYLATVILDLLVALGDRELYTLLLANVEALGIVPCFNAADERRARWRRAGPGVAVHPRVDYLPWDSTMPPHHTRPSPTDPVAALLLSAVARNRHDFQAIWQLLQVAAGSPN